MAAIRFKFDTAWAPPLKALETLVKRFPQLKITLFSSEFGTDVHKLYVIMNGSTKLEMRTRDEGHLLFDDYC